MYELTESWRKSQDRNTSQDSSRPYGREFWDKESEVFISYGRKPQTYMFWTFAWSLALLFTYFSHVIPVSPPPCCPLLNLKSQLPFRSLDVHLVLLLHPLGLHLLASNFVLLQINKISHRVWKSLDSLDIIVCKEPIRMKLNHIYRPFFRLKIIKCNIGNFNRCTEIRCLGCGPILTNRRWTRTNAYFLRRAGALPSVSNVGALPSVSNVAISGSADQTQSLRPSGSLTDRVERVRPLDSQSEEGSVRQRVRPLVDTPWGRERSHWNYDGNWCFKTIKRSSHHNLCLILESLSTVWPIIKDSLWHSQVNENHKEIDGKLWPRLDVLHGLSKLLNFYTPKATKSDSGHCQRQHHSNATVWNFWKSCKDRLVLSISMHGTN